jgi:hypothetical protein
VVWSLLSTSNEHTWTHLLPRPAAALLRRRPLRLGEVVEVRSLGLLELERPCQLVENGLGDAGGVAALELCVVGDADAGEERDLFPAQAGTRRGPLPYVPQPGLFGSDPGASRG